MDDRHTQFLETLAHSRVYLEYQSAFAEMTSLPLVLCPAESWRLPFHGALNENPFCAVLGQSSRACAMCLQMQQKLCLKARQRAATLTCWYGLAVTAVPVCVDGQVLGFLKTGQAFRTPPTASQFRGCLELASTWGVPIPPADLKRVYFRGPVVPARHYAGLVEMLSIFAEHLSLLGSQVAIRQENAEPPLIRSAREFIHERHSENLRLGLVAKAVHSSPFYFCKRFKKAVGLNFTAYVSRVRVDKAKNLLLNPDVEVSEIAYAVGFQSLTHFNRVFKTVVGQTPTGYRRQIQGGPASSPAADAAVPRAAASPAQ